MAYDDLDGLGDFMGAGTEDILGVVAGEGIATATAMGIRMASKDASMVKYSEGLGALAGLATGAVLYFATSKKSAGMLAMASALVGNGLRQLEGLLAGGPTAGYGIPMVSPTQVLRGGFGIATVEPTTAFAGAAPQLVGPPQLVGADAGVGNMPGAQQVRLNGGPQISGLAGAYGATLFSR